MVLLEKPGNQNFDPYQARTTLEYNQTQFYFDGMGATFMSYGNTRLEWQKSLKRNIGLDVEILQRRFTLRVDYYNDKTNRITFTCVRNTFFGIY